VAGSNILTFLSFCHS
jgi:hypothetical protein